MTHKPIISDIDLKAAMHYHLRRSLEDLHFKGQLPAHVAKAVDQSPDAVADLLVQFLAPAAMKRLNAIKADPNSEDPKPPVLSRDDLQVLAGALASLQSSQNRKVDMDTDGALLFCARGLKMLKSERYHDAKRHFQQATRIDAKVKAAWQGLADAQEQLGELDDAAVSRHRAQQL